jgi:hypothetical protein
MYRLLVFLLNIDLIITVLIIYVPFEFKSLKYQKKFKLKIKIYSAKEINIFLSPSKIMMSYH